MKPSKIEPCYWSIEKMPGLSITDQKLLLQHGIQTTFDLLKQSQTPQAKQLLASRLKLSLMQLSKWIALADLGRIPSVSHLYCGLLLHSGIISMGQLAQTPLAKIHPTIKRLHVATMQRNDLVPTVGQVGHWIEEAKVLTHKLK